MTPWRSAVPSFPPFIPAAAVVLALVGASMAEAGTPPFAGVGQIVAHRGSSADRPENTLAALRRAIEAGATAVEVDVRTTKDGPLVMLHDATLDRTTDGTGPLVEKMLAEVRRLDAGGWFDPKYRGERVPTLQEVFAECGERIDILLDLKGQGEEFAQAVAAEVQAHGSQERTIVGVRSIEQARLFRRLLPQSRQLGLIPDIGAIEDFAGAGVETIRLWPKWLGEDAKLVQRVRDAGAKLHLNGTTGRPDEVGPLLEHRPDSLSSDDPARLVQTLAAMQSRRDGKPNGAGRAAERPLHVFILSGQSNMAGMDPKLGFESEVKALLPDAEVVYLKVARGGQPIRHWVARWDEIAKKHGIDAAAARGKGEKPGTLYYEPILQQYRKLTDGRPAPMSVTFCWMQGERDAREGLSAAYADALRQLVADLRRDLKQPGMNVVIGRLSDHGRPGDTHWQQVRKAQVEVAGDDPRGAWVDCDDLNDKTTGGVRRNDLHYTKDGYELLGRRYARQAKALVEGDEPAGDGRPG